MNTVWNYLRGGAKPSAGGDNEGAAAADANTPTTPLDLLVSETAITSAAATVAVRKGKTYLRGGSSGNDASAHSAAAATAPKCVASLYGHEDRVWGLAWHPSGDLFVSCSGDKTAKLWLRRPNNNNNNNNNNVSGDEEEGSYPFSWECVHTIKNEHAGTVRAASWSADGSRLALCSFYGTISIWLVVLKRGRNGAASATINDDGETDNAAANDDDNDDDDEDSNSNNNKSTADLHIELEVSLDGHESEVKGVAWFTDAYNYNYENDRQTAALLASLPSASSSSATAIAAVAKEAFSRINSGDVDPTTSSTEASANAIATYARRPLQIATCSRDRSVWVWEGKPKDEADKDASERRGPIGGGELTRPNLSRGVDYECAGVLTGHPQDIKSVSWAPSAVLVGKNANGPLLQSNNDDDDDVPADATPLAALPPAGLAASGALLSASYDDTVRVWEEHRVRKDDWDCCQTLSGHDGTVWEAAVQPNAEVIETIVAADGEGQQPLLQWRHALPTNSVVVTCSDDGRLVAWQRTTQNQREAYAQVGSVGGFADGRTVYSVSFAPATVTAPATAAASEENGGAKGLTSSYSLAVSDIIAAGTGDDSFALFRLVSGGGADAESAAAAAPSVSFEQVALVAHAHNGEVNCVRFCPNATAASSQQHKASFVELATASDDGEVKIWTVAV